MMQINFISTNIIKSKDIKKRKEVTTRKRKRRTTDVVLLNWFNRI